MYLVDCIPIARGALTGSLTYFTSTHISHGAIVTIPLRGKETQALVIKSQPVSKAKQDIRTLSYKIQKIEKVTAYTFFSETFMQAVEKTNEYYLGAMGNTLALLTPKIILENADKLQTKQEFPQKQKKQVQKKNEPLWIDKIVIQNSDNERLSLYKRRIRESFARKESVFLCLPTLSDIEQLAESFEKGIKKYTVVLHSSFPKKKLLASWEKALNETHPVLIIGTASFLCHPRKDIGTIILDKESSAAYKYQRMPYVDAPFFAEQLARENKITLIVGDVALKTETIYEKEAGKTHPTSDIKYRFLSEAEHKTIDMRAYRGDKSSFKLISNELEEILSLATQNNEHTFIYVNRKGLAPYTICSDCGNIQHCKECGGSLVLYKNTGSLHNPNTGRLIQTFYMCHSCGQVYSSNITCNVCDGWRLTPLGVGIEKIENEIQKQFPKTKIYKIESETVSSYKKGVQIVSQFEKSPGAILLGTEMALLYLRQQVDNVIIGGIDTLFSVPDYRIGERMINILMRMRLLANKKFAVQTRNPEHPVFKAVMSGNLLDFYRNETAERKNFNYPPFTVLIKITKEGRDNTVWDEIKAVAKDLQAFDPIVYQSQYGIPRNRKRLNILIRVKKNKWKDKALADYVQALPPSYRVAVNPAEIL